RRSRRTCSCSPGAPQDQAESLLGRDLQPDRHPACRRRVVSVAGHPAQAGVGGSRDEREHDDGDSERSAASTPGDRRATGLNRWSTAWSTTWLSLGPRHRSSVVELSIRNRAVVGSNPTGGSCRTTGYAAGLATTLT